MTIAEARNYSMTFWVLLPVYLGTLKRIDYPKHICLAHPLSFECFTALKGNHYICYMVYIYLFRFVVAVCNRVNDEEIFHDLVCRLLKVSGNYF